MKGIKHIPEADAAFILETVQEFLVNLLQDIETNFPDELAEYRSKLPGSYTPQPDETIRLAWLAKFEAFTEFEKSVQSKIKAIPKYEHEGNSFSLVRDIPSEEEIRNATDIDTLDKYKMDLFQLRAALLAMKGEEEIFDSSEDIFVIRVDRGTTEEINTIANTVFRLASLVTSSFEGMVIGRSSSKFPGRYCEPYRERQSSTLKAISDIGDRIDERVRVEYMGSLDQSDLAKIRGVRS